MSIRTDHKPVVAVLTVHDGKMDFRGNRRNFRNIVETGTRMGYQVYIVTVRDLNLSHDKVKGFSYNKETRLWEQKEFPRPQVLYNRIPDRNDERKPSVRKKMDEIKCNPGVKLFNPSFFNKWDLFKWLKASESTRQLIPVTKKLSDVSSLNKLLITHPYLYLKPENGKAGKGIMILKYRKDHITPYRLTIQRAKRIITYRAITLSRLWSRIRLETGTDPYIVQQGIELAAYERRHFDLRILVQKNGKGTWNVTGIGARLAGQGSITTHVPRGGSVEEPLELLSAQFGPETGTLLMNKVKSTATLIARQIERGSGGNLGEMSIDLGVDRLSNLWFFEANAKPMKFDEPDIRRKSLRRIFQYSSYLNEQTKS